MLFKKIEKYADSILEANPSSNHNLPSVVTSHDIEKLEVMGPKNTH